MLKTLALAAALLLSIASVALQATSENAPKLSTVTVAIKVTMPPVAIDVPHSRRMDAAVQALVLQRELVDHAGNRCSLRSSITEFLELKPEDVNVIAHARVSIQTDCVETAVARNELLKELRPLRWEKSKRSVYL